MENLKQSSLNIQFECMSGWQTMEIEAWRRAWGADRLIYAGASSRQLPPTARDFLTSYGLPRVFIFEHENASEISFLPIANKLLAYNKVIRWGDFSDREQDRTWRHQLVIGEEEFCNGHASFCIHRIDETITRIDCELDEPEEFVNSTVPQFAESLLLAALWSGANCQDEIWWRTSLAELAHALELKDPDAFDGRKSFWPTLIDHIKDQSPGSFEITCDPARSKPRF